MFSLRVYCTPHNGPLFSELQIKLPYLKLQSCNAYSGSFGAFAKRRNSFRALHYHHGKCHSEYSVALVLFSPHCITATVDQTSNWCCTRSTFYVAVSDGGLLRNNVFLSGAVSRVSLVRCTSHHCVRDAPLLLLFTAWPPIFLTSPLLLPSSGGVCSGGRLLMPSSVWSLSPSAFVALLTDLQWDITAMQVSDTRVHARTAAPVHFFRLTALSH